MISIHEPSRSFGRIIRLWNRLLHHGLEHVPQTMGNAFHRSRRRRHDLERAIESWERENDACSGAPQTAHPQVVSSSSVQHALEQWDNEGGAQPAQGTRSCYCTISSAVPSSDRKSVV